MIFESAGVEFALAIPLERLLPVMESTAQMETAADA
jgi:hypothetical protein